MHAAPDRWVEARTNDGWGIAALVVGLAVACAVGATLVHNRTYRHPTDVTWHGVGGASKAPAAPAAGGAAAAPAPAAH